MLLCELPANASRKFAVASDFATCVPPPRTTQPIDVFIHVRNEKAEILHHVVCEERTGDDDENENNDLRYTRCLQSTNNVIIFFGKERSLGGRAQYIRSLPILPAAVR